MKVSLNVASVRSKLEAWEKSAAGASAKRNKIDEYIQKDKRKTDAGSDIVTLDWASEMADELCDMIRNNAVQMSDNMAGSVLANVNSIHSAEASYMGGGAITVEMSFAGNLMRPSMLDNTNTARYNSYYPVNIVALFEKGYSASSRVYGVWHGAWHASLTQRKGIGFIHSAVEEFNARYARYGVRATILGIYA